MDNDIHDALRAAAADPPPTAIDLDRLIHAELAAGRRRRVALVSTATAVLVGASATSLALGPGGGGITAGPPDCLSVTNDAVPPSVTWDSSYVEPTDPPTPDASTPSSSTQSTPSASSGPSASPGPSGSPWPSGSPSVGPPPVPPEVERATIARLNLALADALASAAPDVVATDAIHPACDPPSFEGSGFGGYSAGLRLDGYPKLPLLSIGLSQVPGEAVCQDSVFNECESRVLPDGTVATTATTNGCGPRVHLYRPDGTDVVLAGGTTSYFTYMTRPNGGDPEWQCRLVGPDGVIEVLAADADAIEDFMIAIGTAPGLTLAP